MKLTREEKELLVKAITHYRNYNISYKSSQFNELSTILEKLNKYKQDDNYN